MTRYRNNNGSHCAAAAVNSAVAAAAGPDAVIGLAARPPAAIGLAARPDDAVGAAGLCRRLASEPDRADDCRFSMLVALGHAAEQDAATKTSCGINSQI